MTLEKAESELMFRHPKQGPFICERCVWKAVAILNEEVEKHRCDVYVATSELHERGVFAGQAIRKGQYVGTYEGVEDVEVTEANERYVMYHYDDVSDVERGWRLGTNEFRFLNHSDDPNLEIDDQCHFWALRSIRKDEELTWYYGDEFSEAQADEE